MTKDDIKLIGDEMVRAVEPISEDLAKIQEAQKQHSEKIDALTGDVIQLQKEVGAIRDDLTTVKDKLTNFQTEVRESTDEIREFVGMPRAIRD